MPWGVRASTRASALALALVAMALLGGPATAAAFQFYDGVSDPPPTYPIGGSGIDIFGNQWGAQSFAASAAYVLAGHGSRSLIVSAKMRPSASISPTS